MKQSGIITKAEIYKYFMEQLVQLKTWESGMPRDSFNDLWTFWKEAAANRNIATPKPVIKVKALQAKYMHWLKSKIS